MTKPESQIAALRMRALRLAESELWAEAAEAWREVIAFVAAIGETKGKFVAAMEHEFKAQYAAAVRRADEAMTFVQPLYKVEGAVSSGPEAAEGAAKQLDAGPTQGDTGAR